MSRDEARYFPDLLHERGAGEEGRDSLKIVAIPKELSVGVEYGLIVLKDAPAAAGDLVGFILGPRGQGILAAYGFGKGANAECIAIRVMCLILVFMVLAPVPVGAPGQTASRSPEIGRYPDYCYRPGARR